MNVGGFVSPIFQMRGKVVFGDVWLPAFKPINFWRCKVPFQSLVPLFSLAEMCSLDCPEGFRVPNSLLLGGFVLLKGVDNAMQMEKVCRV
jgi:hypothetical protein